MIERKTMSQCSSLEYCNGWNDAVVEFTTARFIPVKCVSTQKVFENQVIVGEKYRIDKGSLYIDCDGDVFVNVYGFDYKFIAHMNIDHFIGIRAVAFDASKTYVKGNMTNDIEAIRHYIMTKPHTRPLTWTNREKPDWWEV